MMTSRPAAVKLLTLLIVVDPSQERVLLGKKKRGFGEGYFNGFGGKVEEGETIEQAARRELLEEAGIKAVDCVKVGLLHFHFDDKPVPWEVTVFSCRDYLGKPVETEEMEPQWFSYKSIPYEMMWADDRLWYPLFLAGKRFEGTFNFENTHDLVSHTLRELRD